MLTKRQRVHASIRRKGMDAVPWQFDLTSILRERLQAHYGTEDILEATGDHFIFSSLHYPEELLPKPASPGLRVDEFGVEWGRSSIDRTMGDWGGMIKHPLDEPSLEVLQFPDPSKLRFEHIAALRRKCPDHFLVAHGHGIFERSWSLFGFENYLSFIASDESFVEGLASKLADYSCEATRLLKGLGVDAVRFGDDLGTQSGLMIRPDTWRRIFKPHYRRIYQAAHDIGLTVMIHSCGDITEILPDMIEIGVEVFHPLQPECMDVRRCKREFGRDVSFWGGLGSQSTIPHGSAADVRREVRDRLELFSDGGYILAPAGAAPTETPVENIVAIVDEAKAAFSRTEAEVMSEPAGRH